MKQHKGGILLFTASCIPGCGQMYQRYMKRGASLMTIFWGVMTAAFFLNMEPLLFALFPIWLYAFFDSYNLRDRTEQGQTPEDADEFLFFAPDNQSLHTLMHRRHSIIGWVLVGLGVYMLYNSLIHRILDALLYYFQVADWFYSFFVYDIPRLVVTFGIIALGVWFIRGPKRSFPPEDIPVFIPPAAETTVPGEAAHGEE